MYELAYIIKDSKSIEKFRKGVGCFDAITNGKSNENIEKLFWKTLKHSAPVYGADV